VTGEISNLSRPASGHLYLTLKDSEAQLKAVIWRSTAARLKFQLNDGLDVVVHGKLTIYAKQGSYQLVIDRVEPKGVGALELAFRQLKEKLQRLGWFAEERKKALPRFPRRIGLVTSATGAAIRDMLRIIPRRWPAADILLCPVPVQGDSAAPQIADAIRLLNQAQAVDVMIVGRGGGSLEDLWAFNEEVVAAAIFQSQIPVISAVGHEVDFTIADFVADRRAATPSEAAEIVVPDQGEIRSLVSTRLRHLTVRVHERLGAARKQLAQLAQRRVLRQPLSYIRELEQRLDQLGDRARRAIRVRLDRSRARMDRDGGQLGSLSPLNVLGRGYSLTRKAASPKLLRSAVDVSVGEQIVTRLCHGELTSRVESVSKEASKDGQVP